MHDISDMAVFAEVVRHASFSAAGRKLGLASSVVSDRVKGLERRLGITLLNRTTRSQTLTEAGALYLESAERILADIAALEAQVMHNSQQPKGLLRVTAPIPLGRQHIAAFVAQLRRRYGDINVQLTLNDRFSDIVGEGFDVAIRGGPVIDSRLTGRQLFATRRVLVASPGYLARHGYPATPQALREHSCLVFSSEAHMQAEWRFGRGEQASVLRVEGALASNHSELPVEWAMAGLGITQKSWWEVASAVQQGRLCTLLDDFEPEPVTFYAIHPLRLRESRKVSVFVEGLSEYLREQGFCGAGAV